MIARTHNEGSRFIHSPLAPGSSEWSLEGRIQHKKPCSASSPLRLARGEKLPGNLLTSPGQHESVGPEPTHWSPKV